MATSFSSTAGLQATKGLPVRAPPLRVSRINAKKTSATASVQEQAVSALIGGLVGCSLALTLPDVISPPTAHAGVILQQPERKRIFNGPKSDKKSVEKAAKESSGGGSLSLPNLGSAGTLALPLSLIGITGATVAARKLDGGFDEFLAGTIVKNSTVDGVGYEVAVMNMKPLKASGGGKKK